MEAKDIVAWALSIISIIGALTGAVAYIGRKGYSKGEHDAMHKELRADVDSAHDTLREHDGRISGLEKGGAAMGEKLDAAIGMIKDVQDGVNTINKYLLERNR